MTRTLVMIGVALGLLPVMPASAATINVGMTSDEYDNVMPPGAGCSLREAVQALNNGSDYGGCTPASGSYGASDGIVLPAGTYTLARSAATEDANVSGDLDLSKSMDISGAGDGPAGTVIDANDIDRVIDVLSAGGVNQLRVFNLRIEDGTTLNEGGGIRNSDSDGITMLTNSTVAASHADTGGGIASLGTGSSQLSMSGTEISGNSADDDGGGVFREANTGLTMLVYESLFDHNTSGAEGGGIYQHSSGASSNFVIYRNSTFSGNSAVGGGGGIGLGFAGAGADLRFVTLTGNTTPAAGNGGAIYANASAGTEQIDVRGTLLSGNTAGGVENNCGNAAGMVVYADSSYNVESANTCHLVTAAPKNSLINTNGVLAPLTENGGPTRTHGLYDTSPALNRVPAAGLCTASNMIDQRNMPRPAPMGGLCDVGAFEGSVGPVPPPVSPPAPPHGAQTKKKKCRKAKKKSAAAAKKCKRKKT